jgi:hypothetical protein
MSYYDNDYDDNTNLDEYNENDENNPTMSKNELIILTLNERQDAIFNMYTILSKHIENNNISFMRFMNFRNFTNWFVDHFESDVVN